MNQHGNFGLGLRNSYNPRGSGMPRGISGCGVQDNPQTLSRTPGYTFSRNRARCSVCLFFLRGSTRPPVLLSFCQAWHIRIVKYSSTCFHERDPAFMWHYQPGVNVYYDVFQMAHSQGCITHCIGSPLPPPPPPPKKGGNRYVHTWFEVK
jgi:hypothetical protein